jgi:hypothetical protein
LIFQTSFGRIQNNPLAASIDTYVLQTTAAVRTQSPCSPPAMITWLPSILIRVGPRRHQESSSTRESPVMPTQPRARRGSAVRNTSLEDSASLVTQHLQTCLQQLDAIALTEKVGHCCTTFRVLACASGHRYQPIPAERCRHRLCPNCAHWRQQRTITRLWPALCTLRRRYPGDRPADAWDRSVRVNQCGDRFRGLADRPPVAHACPCAVSTSEREGHRWGADGRRVARPERRSRS